MEALGVVLMLIYMSSWGLFTGMPPLPEDPALANIAPEECLTYFSWAGSGKPDPESTNKTEQLLADEEVRTFLDGLYARLGEDGFLKSIIEDAEPDEAEATRSALRLTSVVMTRPAAGFISKMTFKKGEDGEEAPPDEFAPDDFGRLDPARGFRFVAVQDGEIEEEFGDDPDFGGDPDFGEPDFGGPPVPGLPGVAPFDVPSLQIDEFEGGFVFHAGEQIDVVRKALSDLLKIAEKQDDFGELKKVEVAGVMVYVIESPEGMTLYLGRSGDYFLAAVGEPAAEQILLGLQKKRGPPKWLAAMRDSVKVERPSFRYYVNAAALLKTALEEVTEPEAVEAMKLLGIDRLQSVTSVTGFEGSGMVTKTLYEVTDIGETPLPLVPTTALELEHLKNIPADANFALAGRMNFENVVKYFEKWESLFPEDEEDEAEDFGDDFGGDSEGPLELTEEEKKLAKELAEEFTQSLGPTWTVHNSPSDGGFLFTALTLVVDVKHDQRLRAALEKSTAAAVLKGAAVRKFEFRDTEITYFTPKIGSDEFYGHSAWCIADDKFVWALYPQVIKSYLRRDADEKSLADIPQVRAAVAAGDGPVLLTYFDTPKLYQFVYSLVQIGLPFIDAGLKAAEIDYPIHEVPSAAVLRKYLEPSVMTVRLDARGIVTESRKTLPSAGGSWLFFMPFVAASGS